MHEGSHEYVSLKNEGDKMVVAEKGELLFIFNFHTTNSYQVTYVYDDVTYVYDDVTYVYDDVTFCSSSTCTPPTGTRAIVWAAATRASTRLCSTLTGPSSAVTSAMTGICVCVCVCIHVRVCVCVCVCIRTQ